MGMTREQKQAEVQELQNTFSNDELVVITHYKGLSVSEITELRGKMREQGARFKVTKNSLAKLALKGTRFEQLENFFTGPTGVASSGDPIAAAKVANDFAKKNENFVIIAGAMGEKLLDANAIKQLASLPSLDELRSKIVGLLQAPQTKLAGLLQAPARELVGVTKAYGEKAQ